MYSGALLGPSVDTRLRASFRDFWYGVISTVPCIGQSIVRRCLCLRSTTRELFWEITSGWDAVLSSSLGLTAVTSLRQLRRLLEFSPAAFVVDIGCAGRVPCRLSCTTDAHGSDSADPVEVPRVQFLRGGGRRCAHTAM